MSTFVCEDEIICRIIPAMDVEAKADFAGFGCFSAQEIGDELRRLNVGSRKRSIQ